MSVADRLAHDACDLPASVVQTRIKHSRVAFELVPSLAHSVQRLACGGVMLALALVALLKIGNCCSGDGVSMLASNCELST